MMDCASGYHCRVQPMAEPEFDPASPMSARPDDRLVERFWSATESFGSPERGVELLPTTLAAATAVVLGVDGIGLSVINGRFRVPLGASDDEAAAAERLQFTVGEGPCLHAMADRTEIRVDSRDMERRWPTFYDELASRTTYRSIASIPVVISKGLIGAMDLYFRTESDVFRIDLGDAILIGTQITVAMQATATSTALSVSERDDMVPAWMYGPSARNRLRTWVGAGVLMAHFGGNAEDALMRIRAWAYATGLTLDEATDHIINGNQQPQDLA
jgi:hypothetical protein